MPRSHRSVVLQEWRENARFCETANATPHKNAQKRTKTHKNAQKRTKTHKNAQKRTKTEVFAKCSSKWIFTKTNYLTTFWNSVNAYKRIKTKTTASATTYNSYCMTTTQSDFKKPQQYEEDKT